MWLYAPFFFSVLSAFLIYLSLFCMRHFSVVVRRDFKSSLSPSFSGGLWCNTPSYCLSYVAFPPFSCSKIPCPQELPIGMDVSKKLFNKILLSVLSFLPLPNHPHTAQMSFYFMGCWDVRCGRHPASDSKAVKESCQNILLWDFNYVFCFHSFWSLEGVSCTDPRFIIILPVLSLHPNGLPFLP